MRCFSVEELHEIDNIIVNGMGPGLAALNYQWTYDAQPDGSETEVHVRIVIQKDPNYAS